MADYDKVAEFYHEKRQDSSKFNYNRDIEVPAMIKMLGDVKGKTILEIGCGFGDHAEKLKGFKKLVGLDLSAELIKLAQSRNVENTEFFVHDMDKKLPFPDSSFDVAFSSLAVHYSDDLNSLFREIFRVLRKDSIFCFSTGHPIFNLLNQEKEISFRKNKDGSFEISGDYFDESLKDNDLGGLGRVKLHSYTFETLIKTGLSSGFELVDYADAQPVKTAEKINAHKYRLTTTLPTFILFKFRK